MLTVGSRSPVVDVVDLSYSEASRLWGRTISVEHCFLGTPTSTGAFPRHLNGVPEMIPTTF